MTVPVRVRPVHKRVLLERQQDPPPASTPTPPGGPGSSSSTSTDTGPTAPTSPSSSTTIPSTTSASSTIQTTNSASSPSTTSTQTTPSASSDASSSATSSASSSSRSTTSTTNTASSASSTPTLPSTSFTPTTTVSLSTGTDGSVHTQTFTQTAPPSNTNAADNSNNKGGFFNNKGAVAGVFTVVGVAALIFAFIVITTCLRRRRAREFDREVAEAAAHSQAIDPNALDDDYNGSSGYGGVGSKSAASHGTMMQDPVQPSESYGMRDLGAAGLAGAGAGAAAPGLAGVGGYRGGDDYYRTPDGGYGVARFASQGGYGQGGYGGYGQQGGYGGEQYGQAYGGDYGAQPGYAAYGQAQGYPQGQGEYPQQGQYSQSHQGYAQNEYRPGTEDPFNPQPSQHPNPYEQRQTTPPPGALVPGQRSASASPQPQGAGYALTSPPQQGGQRTSTSHEGPLSTAFNAPASEEDGYGYAYGGEEEPPAQHSVHGGFTSRVREDDEGSVDEQEYGGRRVLKVANAD